MQTEKLLIFRVCGKLYAFKSKLIGEVANYDTAYHLPLMPPYVCGLINRYSTPFLLFDTGLLMGLNALVPSKIAVFKDSVEKIAFLIDEIEDIVDINIDQMNRADSAEDMVEMVFKFNDQDVLLIGYDMLIARVQNDFGGGI